MVREVDNLLIPCRVHFLTVRYVAYQYPGCLLYRSTNERVCFQSGKE